MATIADLIAQSKELGIFEFYLPFIIMFAIMYGLLQRAKIFGDQEKSPQVRSINLIISLAASMFIMIYTPAGPQLLTLSTFISNLFAGTLMIALTLIVFLMVVFMISSAGGKEGTDVTKVGSYVLVGGVILAVGVFIASGGLSIFPGIQLAAGTSAPIINIPGINPQDAAIFIVVVITALALIFMTQSGGSSGGKGKEGK